ncbi:MAG: FtsH protease activity modulator HflK [Holosporaceae bacterium]|jgi:membrane protease subunit HflK|nr:FtsH protease activity modulator HflK [Holosporaceae bacterium]
MSGKNPWEDDGNPWKGKGLGGDFLSGFIRKNKKKVESWGGSGGLKPPSKVSVITVALGLVALYFVSGFYQVQHDQRGIVLRFGKWVRTVGPGLQYVLPYPFEEVFLQKVTTVNQIDVGAFFRNQPEESLMLTGDSNLANISFSVLWKIKEDGVEDYLFNAKAPEVTVRAVSEGSMREIVGQTPFTYVQTDGRGEIQNKVKESLQAVMDEYKMGIEIIRVELQRVEPPASVVDSFRDVERAQAEQQSEKNKAEAYDRETRARTRGLIAEKINNGEALKRSIVETANGAVARFLSAYSQYKLAPDIVSKRLYIETMRDIYREVNKIIIDGDVKSVPYLPLTELNRLKSSKEEVSEK